MQDFGYIYDIFANLAARTDNNRNLEETFTYDHLNRLTDIRLNGVPTGHMAYDALGRMTDKRTDGQQVFSSAQHDYVGPDGQLRPHAVSSATMQDFSPATDCQEITYTMFDKVRHITIGNFMPSTIEFSYGFDHQRTGMQIETSAAFLAEKTYVGNCEFVDYGGGDESYTFISGPLGVFAVVEKKVNGVESVHYVLKDHLGSRTTVTDADGTVEREQSFDAWGNMRDPDTWTGTVTQQPMFDRGFTGHEHLNAFGLINMNGRMYDPIMSSFLSVDNYVQCPDFSQNFNRYAYCLNNPLKYTDPSGEIPVLAVVAIGAAVNVIMNGINNVRHGENFFHGAGPAAVTGGVQGLFTYGIGESANAIGTAIKNQATAHLAKAGFQLVAHGTMGGMSTMSRGGKFWHGFVSSATASVMSTAINQTCIHFQLSEGLTKTAMIAGGALSGGISAKMAGGDFIDGFCNGLICAGLNHALHFVAGEGVVWLKNIERLQQLTQSDALAKSPEMCKYCVVRMIEKYFFGDNARSEWALKTAAGDLNEKFSESMCEFYQSFASGYSVWDVDPYSPTAIEECLKSGEPVVFSDYGSKDGHHAYLVTGVKTCSDGSHSLYMIDPLTGGTKDIHWSTIQNMNVNNFEFTQFAKYTNTNYKLR